MKLVEDLTKIDYKIIEDFEKKAMEMVKKAIPDLQIDDTILSTVSQPMILAINLLFPIDKIIIKGGINDLVKEALSDQAAESMVQNVQRHSIKRLTSFYFIRCDLPAMLQFGGQLVSYSNVPNSRIIVPATQPANAKRIVQTVKR